ncbi:DUF3021 domain-containing protein [Thalassobacillus sp. C254]|uniref:DUF3021 domain-containing protein n=1 Tax=Thalassobacillus sp. C254 TaxID=1225341 RepID=UPI0006D0DD54|nr:DUF3021 domain-containing protein [Thalassobacillus sp. C254]
MIEVIRRGFAGLGFAGIFTFAALTIMMIQGIEASVSTIWLNMLGSILMGVYFGCASFIYEIESWSPLKQTTVHFMVSVGLWLPLAIFIGWLPFSVMPVLIGLLLFIVVYAIFWQGTKLYLQRLANEMNDTV